MDWNEIRVSSSKSMSDKLFDEISQRILSGELPEGYVFPNEAVLCEELRVGRSTIREAYKALELSGYVTRSKKGTFVNSRLDILSATPIKQAFVSADSRDFNEFREVVEVRSAELAAERATKEDIAALQDIIKASKALYEAGHIDDVAAKDMEFHRAISKMSGNKLILSVMVIMTLAWNKGVRRNFFHAMTHNPQIFHDMYSQHEAVVQAIASGDAERAGAAMKAHIGCVTAPLE